MREETRLSRRITSDQLLLVNDCSKVCPLQQHWNDYESDSESAPPSLHPLHFTIHRASAQSRDSSVSSDHIPKSEVDFDPITGTYGRKLRLGGTDEDEICNIQ